jgi:tape measure domain-containing protein
METYSVEAILAATDKSFSKTMNDAEKSMGGLGKQSNELGDQLSASTKKGGELTKSILGTAMGVGAIKLVSSAMGMVKDSVAGAISRFDTLNKYPVVMKSLGYSAEDVDKSMTKLGDGIDGLPTSLDEIVASTQQLSIATGSLRTGTDTAIALNNAFLASGASTADASRGMQQYIQMLGKGEVDMQSWRSLQETMPVAMDKVAKSFKEQGVTSVNDLYDALKEGDITFKEFNGRLIELNEGVGGFADLARKNSEGVATSWQNIKTATVKGVTTVIQAFNNMIQEVTGKSIAKNLDGLKVLVNSTFNSIKLIIQGTTPVVKLFAQGISGLITVAKPLEPVLFGIAAAFAALKIIQGINSLVQKSYELFYLAGMSGKALTIVTKAHAAAQLAGTAATKADIMARAAQNGQVTIGTALIGLMTGAVSLSTVATTLMTAATTAFNVALKVLLGPVGWVMAAVGGLTAAGIALWKWLNKETEASKKLNAEQDKLSQSTKTLTDSVEQNSNTRKDNLRDIASNATAYQKLGDSVTDLASKEKLSAVEKKILKSNVDELNKSVSGLNLIYDQESNKLSMSTEQIKARIAALQQQESANVSQQALTDILKEQASVESKLKENSTMRQEWNDKLKDGSVKMKEYREAVKGLDDQEKTLKSTQADLKTEYTSTQEVLESSLNSVAQATEAGVFKQVISYQTLNDAQKTTVDNMKAKWQEYSDAATNMFDTLTDKQTMSVQQMQANLEENQRVIGTWADNISNLADRGLDEGLLNKLREAGPESAGYVAALVSASDEELNKMSETFRNGGEVATTAFKTAFKTGDIPGEVTAMVTSAKESLSSQIQTANFGELGKNVAQGTAQGINEGAPEAGKASQDMASDVAEKFAGELDINSPSRVFKSYGGFIADGVVLGIQESASKVKAAIDSLATIFTASGLKINQEAANISRSIPRSFDNLDNEMNSIGINIMAGLANGINAGASAALLAAQNIANQIINTTKNALDIHSPSRVMRDEVGKMIPAGIAVGIQKNLSIVKKPMEKLSEKLYSSSGIFDKNQPQLGFNDPSSSWAFSGNLATGITIEVPVNLDGKQIAKVTAKPMSKELKQLTNKQNTALGRRG